MHTHNTAPTQTVDTNGIRFSYRRFATRAGFPWCSTSTSVAPSTTGTRR